MLCRLLAELGVERRSDATRNLVDCAEAIDRHQNASLGEEVDQRCGLLCVDVLAMTNHFFGVVFATLDLCALEQSRNDLVGVGDWTALGLSRPGWESLHLTMGALFLGAGGWHIALHGSVITNLLRGAGGAVLGHRRELALAGALVALVLVTALADWPPASWLADLQGWFKRDFW